MAAARHPPADHHEAHQPPAVGLSYIDVLFGLAAARAFASAFDNVARLSAVEWSHFLVVLVLITSSWVGYHLNRTSTTHPPRQPSFSPRAKAPLAQFGIDIALVALYYRLASRLDLDLTVHTELRLLAAIFALYLVWDLLDFSADPGDHRGTRVRAIVDGASLIAFAALRALWPPSRVVALDGLVIVVLLAYRYIPNIVLHEG